MPPCISNHDGEDLGSDPNPYNTTLPYTLQQCEESSFGKILQLLLAVIPKSGLKLCIGKLDQASIQSGVYVTIVACCSVHGLN